VGTISSSGVYTAPASIASAQNVTVTATSTADATKSATTTVTLTPPVSVTATPASVTLTQSQTQNFSATVTNAGNTAVTWSLSPAVGSITATGLYTAPTSIASSQTVTVTATSVADSTKSATATVALNPPVTVSLTPSSVSLQPSQNQTVTAAVSGTSNTAVTWSFSPALGSLASGMTTAVYVAPGTAPTTQSVTITATSMADSSTTATAVITLLQATTTSLSPSTVSLAPSGTQQFTPTVLGTTNTAVTWSINPSVGTISPAGLYTAPSSILTSQTVTVTAQSVADATRSASATISLSPPTGTFTYYVDSINGSDSNPGTLAEPWQTIAKVNATTLQPGQSVGFKSGDTWREQLNVTSSGAAGKPITFAAYGGGARPIISGANVLSPSWTATSTAIYSWTSEAPGFSVNDSAGHTYTIKNGSTTVASGSVTQSNMRLSTISGASFVDFSLPGALTPYLGDLLTITDSSASRQLSGYISQAGTGETYGRQLLPDPGMDTLTAFSLYNATGTVLSSGCQSGSCLQLTATSAYGWAAQIFSVTAGMLVRSSAYLEVGTETSFLQIAILDPSFTQLNTSGYGLPGAWTQDVVYATADVTGSGFMQKFSATTVGDTSLFDTASVQQVLTPSTTGVTITATGSNATIYYTSYSTAPSQVFEDGVRLAQNTASSDSLTPGQWYLDMANSRIWVRTTTDDNPSGHTMEASERANVVQLYGANYITVQNLELDAGSNTCVFVQANSNQFVISDNVLNFCGSINFDAAVEAKGATHGRVTGNTVSYSYSGIVLTEFGGFTTDSLQIDHNKISYSALQGVNLAAGVTNATVEYNSVDHSLQVVDDTAGIYSGGAGAGNVIRYNESVSNGTASTRGAGYMIDIGSAATQVYGNVAAFNTNGCIDEGSGSPSTIYNNTCYEDNQQGWDAGELNTFASSSGVIFENNIVFASVGKHTLVSMAGNVYAYNLYYGGSTTPFEWAGTQYAFAGYQTASGQDAGPHSMQADPLFTNAAGGDFTLQPGSPAIGAGVYIPGVSTANPPNIGAN